MDQLKAIHFSKTTIAFCQLYTFVKLKNEEEKENIVMVFKTIYNRNILSI